MKFKDGKTFSAYVRSKLHSGYITMQLISALESNKHENTNPPVSILNIVPLDLPVSIV